MKVVIQSVHFSADQNLKDFIQSKLNKLDHFFDSIIDAHVSLKIEKNKEIGNKVLDIKLLVPANTIYAKQQGRTFEEAMDLCVDQVKRQLMKYKEKSRAS